jgi:hypothetical protein
VLRRVRHSLRLAPAEGPLGGFRETLSITSQQLPLFGLAVSLGIGLLIGAER